MILLNWLRILSHDCGLVHHCSRPFPHVVILIPSVTPESSLAGKARPGLVDWFPS